MYIAKKVLDIGCTKCIFVNEMRKIGILAGIRSGF
jgi:hypothetical protein